jgi:hypothetical protein
MPSKDAYAIELHQQMAARAVQKASEDNWQRDAVGSVEDEDALDEILRGKGRRHGGPAAKPAKSLYAADLEQQIAARKAAVQEEVNAELATPRGGLAFSEQRELVRGRRDASKMDQVSKSSYTSVIQEQIAQKAAQRAANAFHVKTSSEADAQALPGQDGTPKGAGRRKCDLAPTSKESYARALQEQIAAKAFQQGTLGECPQQSAFVGGKASDMGPLRGRRRVENMAPSSKDQYRMDLQRQMAEVDQQRAANKFPNAVKDLPDQPDLARGDSLERLLGANADHCAEKFW